MTFVRICAIFIKSRPDRGENSTAYTTPSCDYQQKSDKQREMRLNATDRAHDIRNMTDASPTSSAKIQHLLPGLDENIVQTTKDTSSKLASERIPYSILDFCT